MAAELDQLRQHVMGNPTYKNVTAGMNDTREREYLNSLVANPNAVNQLATGGNASDLRALYNAVANVASQQRATQATNPATLSNPSGQPGPVETPESALAAANVRRMQEELAQSRHEFDVKTAQLNQQFDANLALEKSRLASQIAQQEAQLAQGKEQFNTSLAWEKERYGVDNTFRYADLGLRERTLDAQRESQAADRDIQRAQLTLQENMHAQDLALNQAKLGLDTELGRGNLALGQGRLGLDTELGRGNLALGQERLGLDTTLGLGRLGLDTQQLAQQGQLGAAQLLSNLKGPRDWLRYHAAQQGLRQGGLPDSIEAVLGFLQQNGGVAPGVQYPVNAPAPNLIDSLRAAGATPLTNEHVQQRLAGQEIPAAQVSTPGAGMSRMLPGLANAQAGSAATTAAAVQAATPGAGMSRMTPGVGANPAGATAPPPAPFPRGTQVNPQAFLSMTPDEREMLLGAVEAAGGSANDFLSELQKTLPRAGTNARAGIRY